MLHVLGLTTLKRRRIRNYLTETYKILFRKEIAESEIFFH